MKVRAVSGEEDWQWILEHAGPIGGAQVVSRGVLHTLQDHTALLAEEDRQKLGFAVYRMEGSECELLAILAVDQWRGTGSLLLEAVVAEARRAACNRVCLVTTNDNVDALRFYQKRGFRLNLLRVDAFDEVIRLKGLERQHPVLGHHAIPIRDEILLSRSL